jgi:uncharacterized protein (UPF0332 family)
VSKVPLTAGHMRKAQRALESNHVLREQGDAEGACNRAYYAMFYAAHVALQAVGAIKTGAIYKTHSGLISAFSRDLVLTKRLPDQMGRSLAQVYNMRLLVDYSGDPPKERDVDWVVSQAEAFVAAIQRLVCEL